MVGNHDQRAGIAQLIEFAQVETTGTHRFKESEIDAKTVADGKAPQALPETPRQQRLQQ